MNYNQLCIINVCAVNLHKCINLYFFTRVSLQSIHVQHGLSDATPLPQFGIPAEESMEAQFCHSVQNYVCIHVYTF